MEGQSPLFWRLGDVPIKKVAILRALQVGDLLCAIPAIRALRQSLPHTEIVLIGLPWAQCLVERYPNYFDGFLEFPGFPGLPERSFAAQQVAEFLVRAQQEKFDLAIQMHGSGAFVNPLIALLGARMQAGFYTASDWRPDAERFLIYPEGEHEIHRHLRLVEFLGVRTAGDELEFPVYQRDYEELASISEANQLQTGNYVCIHPGARYLSRRWPVERYAAAANWLARQGLQVVITGMEKEAALAEELSNAIEAPAVNLAGRTSLGSLAALISGARLQISNDTGVAHLAAALQTPSVVVVTGSDPTRWAPLNRARHRVVSHRVECQPCEYVICPIGHPCATGLSAATVLEAARELLDQFSLDGTAQQGVPRDLAALQNSISITSPPLE